MKSYGGNLSHSKHRSGAFGGPSRGHRAEVARLLRKPQRSRAQRMYGSIADLMRGRTAK